MKIPKRYSHIISPIYISRGQTNNLKTAISCPESYLYKVVTRVNVLTSQLWLIHRNELLKKHGIKPDSQGFCGMNKVNWLTMIANWRREQDIRIKHINSDLTDKEIDDLIKQRMRKFN